MKKSLRFGLVIIVILFIALKIGVGSKSVEKSVDKASPEMRKLEETILLSGAIVPDQKIEVKSHISGIIEQIYIKEGQLIRKGDRIATIRVNPDPLQLEQSLNRWEVAQIELINAREEMQRQKKLFDKSIISKTDFRIYQEKVELAEMKQESAERQYNIVLNGYTNKQSFVTNEILATGKGTVVSVKLKPGSWINASNNYNPGDIICELADLDNLIFRGEVDELHVPKMKMDMPVEITVNSIKNSAVTSKIKHVSYEGVEENGIVRFKVECDFKNKGSYVMRSGYSATAKIITSDRGKVLCLPERFINYSDKDGKTFVLKTSGDKRDTVYVRTGISDGVYTEILDELSTKDVFVK